MLTTFVKPFGAILHGKTLITSGFTTYSPHPAVLHRQSVGDWLRSIVTIRLKSWQPKTHTICPCYAGRPSPQDCPAKSLVFVFRHGLLEPLSHIFTIAVFSFWLLESSVAGCKSWRARLSMFVFVFR